MERSHSPIMIGLEILRRDYIRTGWSKGLKEKVIILRHALPNALIPVITVIASPLINIFGDALRDLLDPRLRGAGGRYGKSQARSRQKRAS